MKKQATLTTWLFTAPFKFAIFSFIITTLITFGYSVLSGIFFPTADQVSMTPLFILLTLGIAMCVYLTVRKLPNIKMDRPSFIAIYNAQIIFLLLLFAVSTYLLISHQQELFFHLMMFDMRNSGFFALIVIIIALYFLFLIGTAIINLYLKIRRIQEFNIPNWKIICSFPFGFGMLWTPGYLLNTKSIKKPSQPIKSKTYSKITNWALENTTNTISMFVLITILSGFFVGTMPILITFISALIFGLWVSHTGTKEFGKQIHKNYATSAVIINIIMITTVVCLYIFTPKPHIEISISDTNIITTQGQ